MICEDDWNAKKLPNAISQKWLSFLDKLELVDKRGDQKVNVGYLLDFAGYKEVEEQLIEQGVEVEEITTASHYREVKKLTDDKKMEDYYYFYERLLR